MSMCETDEIGSWWKYELMKYEADENKYLKCVSYNPSFGQHSLWIKNITEIIYDSVQCKLMYLTSELTALGSFSVPYWPL